MDSKHVGLCEPLYPVWITTAIVKTTKGFTRSGSRQCWRCGLGPCTKYGGLRKSPGQRASANPNPTLFSKESPVIRDLYYRFKDTLWRLIEIMTQSLDIFPGIWAHYLSSLLGGYPKFWRKSLGVQDFWCRPP